LHYFTTSRKQGIPETVFWKDVQEGWVRYDQRSGSTNLLTSLARFVIDFIDMSSSPLSSSDITSEVLRAEPDADPDQCRVEVETVLKVLSDAQLIQRIQP